MSCLFFFFLHFSTILCFSCFAFLLVSLFLSVLSLPLATSLLSMVVKTPRTVLVLLPVSSYLARVPVCPFAHAIICSVVYAYLFPPPLSFPLFPLVPWLFSLLCGMLSCCCLFLSFSLFFPCPAYFPTAFDNRQVISRARLATVREREVSFSLARASLQRLDCWLQNEKQSNKGADQQTRTRNEMAIYRQLWGPSNPFTGEPRRWEQHLKNCELICP